MASRGLAWGSSGNLSARSDEETFRLSASGTWFEQITAGDFVACRVDDGAWAGDRRPSKEIGMHRAVYAARPEARWVLHCTPPSATVLACQRRLPDRGAFVEGMAYLHRLAGVDYHHPGTIELGEAVGVAAGTADALLLWNHGVLVFDADLAEARMRLLSLEFACALQLASEAGPRAARTLPASIVDDFVARRIYRPLPLSSS